MTAVPKHGVIFIGDTCLQGLQRRPTRGVEGVDPVEHQVAGVLCRCRVQPCTAILGPVIFCFGWESVLLLSKLFICLPFCFRLVL